MAFVASSAIVVGALVVGGTLAEQNDASRKARNTTKDAMKAADQARQDDARKSIEAETGAAVSANAALADTNRRRRTSALAMGAPGSSNATSSTLGGGSVLASGAK